MLIRTLLGCAALAMPCNAYGAFAEPQGDRFCQLAQSARAQVGRSVVITARIVFLGSHGWYVEARECPDQRLDAFPTADPDKRTLKTVLDASNIPGVFPEKITTFRADVIMHEWFRPITGEREIRPMLEITEVIRWEPVK